MNRSNLLLTDGLINLALGVLLVASPRALPETLGLPAVATGFYPSILGAVLLGIGIALCIEWRRQPTGIGGLGLVGAITINLCGGACLAGWLLLGSLDIPVRGQVVLWALVVVLVGISGAEWLTHARPREAEGGRP